MNDDGRVSYFVIGVYVGLLAYFAWRRLERRFEEIDDRQRELWIELHPPQPLPEAPQ